MSIHKHKKGKVLSKKTYDFGESDYQAPDSSYPDMSSSNASPYPSLDPMPGYPSIEGSFNDFHVPTKGSSGMKSSGYSAFDDMNAGAMPVAMPSLASYSVPKYVSPTEASYPSFDGISKTKFHEEIKKPAKKSKEKKVATSSLSYPTFDDGGNIISDECEPTASVQMPYSGIKMSKPDKDLTIEECCLYCNLLTLFITYEYDDSNVLTPSHVRQALDSITGNNEIYGFSEGSMACAQETFEEILRYLHREHIKPKYYEKYCDNLEKLKKKEEEFDDTGCSLAWVSHKTFGLEIGEFLSWENWGFVSEVQSSHLDYLINLYSEELLRLKDSPYDWLDTLVSRMYKYESYERK